MYTLYICIIFVTYVGLCVCVCVCVCVCMRACMFELHYFICPGLCHKDKIVGGRFQQIIQQTVQTLHLFVIHFVKARWTYCQETSHVIDRSTIHYMAIYVIYLML